MRSQQVILRSSCGKGEEGNGGKHASGGAAMTGSWGWAHIQGERIQFSKRTYSTAAQARDGLQDHLDVQAGKDTRDAATRLRALPAWPHDVSVHIPGRSWYVQETHKDIRVFAGDTVHTFRRPASTAQRAAAEMAAERGHRRHRRTAETGCFSSSSSSRLLQRAALVEDGGQGPGEARGDQ